MKLYMFCLLLCTPAVWSQVSTGSARTTGSCSPAVSGSNNKFTITCEGVPREKAEELTQLMNKILQQQLDPKKVYSELDRINTNINDLGVTINPLINAPPAEAEFLKNSRDVGMSCYDFLGVWTHDYRDKRKEYNEKQRRAVMAHQRPETGKLLEVSEAVDQEEVAKYEKTLAPKLVEWRSQLVQQVPNVSSIQDYSAVKTGQDLSDICQDLSKLVYAYQKKITEEVQTSHHH